MQFNSYIVFNGQCEEAMNFYKECFNADKVEISKVGEGPMKDQLPEKMHNDVMHSVLHVGESQIFASDMLGEEKVERGNSFQISVNLDDDNEAKEIYNKLAQGGFEIMPLEETFWAKAFGMVKDKYGVVWMLNVANEQYSA